MHNSHIQGGWNSITSVIKNNYSKNNNAPARLTGTFTRGVAA